MIFDWSGRRYKGNHQPTVSKELFDRVQEVLAEKGRRRTRQQKHHWAFQGFVSCGHCGCALTGEIKKGLSSIRTLSFWDYTIVLGRRK